MSYQSYVFEGLYTIVWGQTPEVEDVSRYVSEIRVAHRTQGRKVMGIGIVPEHSDPPSEAFRVAQAAIVPELVRHLECGAIVFHGTGVAAKLKRTAFAAMTLLVRVPCPIYVRASVEDALLGRPPQSLRFDPYDAVARLKRLGVY